ncbi:unnamed protein product [Leptidea sinapis]|uniref:Uncharacterized protein n=1 Tax=Leptidea sinapis TaxID=189913 RepID=A0A5E4PKE9_9NEOP|nr:unnamed protein product [Leptidea sinapis]
MVTLMPCSYLGGGSPRCSLDHTEPKPKYNPLDWVIVYIRLHMTIYSQFTFREINRTKRQCPLKQCTKRKRQIHKTTQR